MPEYFHSKQSTLSKFQAHLDVVKSDEFGGGPSEGASAEDKEKSLPKPAAVSLQQVEAWLQLMTFFHENEDKYKLVRFVANFFFIIIFVSGFFRMCVSKMATKEKLPDYDPTSIIGQIRLPGYHQSQSRGTQRDYELKVEFWCMDPSLVGLFVDAYALLVVNVYYTKS